MVEVDLQDAGLAQQGLERKRQQGLLRLARHAAFATEEQVLGQLLGDGRAADHLRDAASVLALGGARLGTLVLAPGLLDRLPLDAVVFKESAVLAGDHGARQVGADGGQRHPLLRPGQPPVARHDARHLAALKGGGLRVDPVHGRDAQQEIQLQRQQRQQRQHQQAQRALHAPLRSCASTAAVSGRKPCQRWKASAACSTSMPRPSRRWPACWPAAQARKGSAAAP